MEGQLSEVVQIEFSTEKIDVKLDVAIMVQLGTNIVAQKLADIRQFLASLTESFHLDSKKRVRYGRHWTVLEALFLAWLTFKHSPLKLLHKNISFFSCLFHGSSVC